MNKLLLTIGLSLWATAISGQQLNETFQNENLPDGWTAKNAGGTYQWATASFSTDANLGILSGFSSGGEYAIKSTTGYSNSSQEPAPDSWLITPKIIAGNGDILHFMMAYQYSYNANTRVPDEAKVKFEVLVSDTGTEKEDFSCTLLSFVPEDMGNWNNYSFDLSPFAGKEIYIAFRDHGQTTGSPFLKNSMYLDNITINQTKASDLSVVSIGSPFSSCKTEQAVKATIKNVGFDAETFTACYQVDNNAVVSEKVNQQLKGGTAMQHEFHTKAVLTQGMSHTVKVWVESDTDLNHDNDSQTITAETGNEMPYPFTMTDENAETAFRSSNTVQIGKNTYGWSYYNDETAKGWGYTHHNSVTSYLVSNCIALPQGTVRIHFEYMSMTDCNMTVYLVTEGGKYDNPLVTSSLPASLDMTGKYFTVEIPEADMYQLALKPDGNSNMGQIFIDNIQITDPYDDIATISIDSPRYNATLAKQGIEVKATFKNNSNRELTNVPVRFKAEGQTTVEETIASIPAGEELQYTFSSSTLDLSKAGKYDIDVWADLDSDGNKSNDKQTRTVMAYASQEFPFSASFEANDANENWICYNPDNDLIGWEIMQVINDNINYAKDGKCAAYISSVAGTEHNDWLISPAIHAKKGDARISFYYTTRMNSSSGNTHCNIKVYLTQTDNTEAIKASGEPLTVAEITDKNVLQYAQGYTPVSIPSDGVYYLAFYNDGMGHDIILDDIRFDQNEDMAILSASNSASSDFNLTENEVTIEFANHGMTAQSNIPLSYTVNGETEVKETFSGSIAPGEKKSYTFRTKADISKSGTYVIVSKISATSDSDPYNDMWTSPEITHFTNKQIPYSEDFEPTEQQQPQWMTEGNWTLAGNMIFAQSAYNGTGGLFHTGVANGEWAYSGCIEIPAGTYELSFFYRTLLNQSDPDLYGQDFEVYLGTARNSDMMTIPVYKAEKTVAATKRYAKVIEPVTIDNGGQYYIGIKCTTKSSHGSLYIDMVELAKPASDGIALGTYEADFTDKESEWYHYNPSKVFPQWTPQSSTEGTFMETVRTNDHILGSDEFPGVYVAPAFMLKQGDEINVSFDYMLSINNPENLAEEELEKVNIGLYMADRNHPEAFTTQVALGNALSERQTATGKVVIPADGIYYFGFITNGPSSAISGKASTIYNLYSAKIWNDIQAGLPSEVNKKMFLFENNRLHILNEYRTVRIYNANGMPVGSYSGIRQIDLSRMPTGIYLVHIISGQETETGKIYIR